jgi:hypothetical protein
MTDNAGVTIIPRVLLAIVSQIINEAILLLSKTLLGLVRQSRRLCAALHCARQLEGDINRISCKRGMKISPENMAEMPARAVDLVSLLCKRSRKAGKWRLILVAGDYFEFQARAL